MIVGLVCVSKLHSVSKSPGLKLTKAGQRPAQCVASTIISNKTITSNKREVYKARQTDKQKTQRPVERPRSPQDEEEKNRERGRG